MIRQQFDTDGYWKVIVYYDLDYDFLRPVYKELRSIGFSVYEIREVIDELEDGDAKAVTFSNGYYYTSIILFAPHEDRRDYVNSIVHEAEHVKQAMLETYWVEDKGEPPAYTVGYIVMRMYDVFRNIVCEKC